MRRIFREPFSGLSHLAAAVLAAVGTGVLLLRTDGGLDRRVPMAIYGASLVAMFSASAVYHLVRSSRRSLDMLRKVDHSAIYLLIAGTYTPTSYLVLDDPWRTGTLAVVWTLAIGGIIYKVFTIGKRRWLYTALYLVMGWMGVIVIGQLISRLPLGALVWTVLGGLVYTAGAILYILKWPRLRPGVFGFHDLWHLFVIGGALCHFLMHLLYLAPLAGQL